MTEPSPSPRAAVLLGNDVVDLRHPRCQDKARSERFLSRVFAPSERGTILSHPFPERALWASWGLKEAGYKVVTKLLGSPPPFEHTRFVTDLELPPGPTGAFTGTMAYGPHAVPAVGTLEEGWLHVLAWHRGAAEAPAAEPPQGVDWAVSPLSGAPEPEGDSWRSTLETRFTPREWAAVHGRASAQVRLELRAAAARRLGVAESAVEVVCPGNGPLGRTPPVLFVDGSGVNLDVSLSHHGEYLAWTLG